MLRQPWGRSFPCTAVLLAGGVGSRFGGARPKQMRLLGGMPVLFHVFRRFDEHPLVEEIVVPSHAEWADDIADIASGAIRRTPWRLAPGGASRNESVLSGVLLRSPSCERVLVHDGARPLVTADLISRSLEALDGADAVLPVIPAVDPVLEVDGDRVVRFLPRHDLRRGQTPQVFRADLLVRVLTQATPEQLRAYETLYELLLAAEPASVVRCVEGDERNLKITVPSDHLLAGQLLLASGDA